MATLSKGYDLEYIWKQVDRGPAKDAASYYIQASESGGEPPGRWWGPGAKALGFEPGQTVERNAYDLLFGERRAPDGTPLAGLSMPARLQRPTDRRGDRTFDVSEGVGGAYRGVAQGVAAGQWDLVIEADHDGQRVFLSRNRVVLN